MKNNPIAVPFSVRDWFSHEHVEFPGESPIDYYRLDSECVDDFHQIAVADGCIEVTPASAPSRGTFTVLELLTYADELQRVARAALHLNAKAGAA